MAKDIKQKEKSFGTAAIDHFTPSDFAENAPKAINVVLSFEEALKLHLSIGQTLAKLNSYDRAHAAGRDSALRLCLFVDKKRIGINEGSVKKS